MRLSVGLGLFGGEFSLGHCIWEAMLVRLDEVVRGTSQSVKRAGQSPSQAAACLSRRHSAALASEHAAMLLQRASLWISATHPVKCQRCVLGRKTLQVLGHDSLHFI